MKKTDGSIAASPQENADVFHEHFQKMFARPPSNEDGIVDQH